MLGRLDIRRLFRGVGRHIYVILASTLVFFFIGAFFTYQKLTTYTSEAVILYQEAVKNTPEGISLTQLSAETAIDMITLSSNMEGVKALLGLSFEPEEIKKMVSINPPQRNSYLIRVNVDGDQPLLVQDLANTVASVAVKNSQDLIRRQLQQGLENYTNQLKDLRQRLMLQINDLEEFKKFHQLFEMTPDHSLLLGRLEEARQKKEVAAAAFSNLFVEYENSKRQQEEVADTENSTKQQLEMELIRMQSKLRSAQKAQQRANEAFEKINASMKDVPAQQMSFMKLLQAKEITESQLKKMENEVEHIKLLLKSLKGNLDIYQLARKGKPQGEGLFILLLPLLGAVSGFGAGLFFAFLTEVFDRRFRTEKELKAAYGLPCWAEIPKLPPRDTPQGQKLADFFTVELAEKLERLPAWQIVTLTSTFSQEGKSLLAWNLSKYFSGQGKKTLYLCSDHYTGDELSGLSLERYLQGEGTLDELIQTNSIDQILTGKIPSEMKELVKSKKMSNLLSELKNRYEVIIIDAPGVLEEVSAIKWTEFADVSLYMIDSSTTVKTHIDQALALMDEVHVKPAALILQNVSSEYITSERVRREMSRANPGIFSRISFWRN